MDVNVSRIASASKSVETSVTFGAGGMLRNGLRQLKSGETLIGPPRASRSDVDEKGRLEGVRGVVAWHSTVMGFVRLLVPCRSQLAAELLRLARRSVGADIVAMETPSFV